MSGPASTTLVTEAVVVRLVDYGEADRILTLFTRAAGKLGALAKSARKSQRRFAGAALFTIGEATLRKRRGELWACEGFTPKNGHAGIALDVTRVAHAAYATELARELVAVEVRDDRIYDLVTGMLSDIERGGVGPAELRVYELALLDAVGLAPSLERCVACDGPPGDDLHQRLDARRGGLLCGRCGERGEGPLLDGEVRRALVDAQQGRAMTGLPAVALAARAAVQSLLGEHLTHPLRSLEFIAKLNAATRTG